jgi:hypothetical protein
MTRKATVQRMKTPAKPIDKEAIVVECLVSGQSITDAAKAAGLDRGTIHRWMRINFRFQSRLDQARLRVREELHDRIMTLAMQCLGTVEKAIGEGDARTAIELLKGSGILNGTPSVISRESWEERYASHVTESYGAQTKTLTQGEKAEARELALEQMGEWEDDDEEDEEDEEDYTE